MALRGTSVGPSVRLETDGGGKPVVGTDPPEAPEGFEASYTLVDTGERIEQVWSVEPRSRGEDALAVAAMAARSLPDAGTAQDAAMALAEMQAAKLADDDALKVPALFPRYEKGHVYAQGDRALWQGALYKATSGHTASADDPTRDPQHWARVVPAQPGGEKAEDWVSGKAYARGARVTRRGQVYESLVDKNTTEPGVFGSESAWSVVADGK